MAEFLNLDALLGAAKPRKAARVQASEIKPGAVIYIAALGPDERDLLESQFANYQKAHNREGSNVGFRLFVFAWCLCDADNNRLLDSGPEDQRVTPDFIEKMKALGESVPLPVINRGFSKAMQKLGMTKGDVEELEGNSETTTSGGGSGSKPGTTAKAGKGSSRRSKARKS